MIRDYATGISESVIFFIGTEVEHTPMFGERTLFVVGLHDGNFIAELARQHKCHHIYFGANQSFNPTNVNDIETWRPWEHMINTCLNVDFWCTLDLDVKDVSGLCEGGLCEERRFIPQISVKIPYLAQLNYNATIKIDDIGFEASNPGVWCHRLRDLTNYDVFTDWDQYSKDEVLK